MEDSGYVLVKRPCNCGTARADAARAALAKAAARGEGVVAKRLQPPAQTTQGHPFRPSGATVQAAGGTRGPWGRGTPGR